MHASIHFASPLVLPRFNDIVLQHYARQLKSIEILVPFRCLTWRRERCTFSSSGVRMNSTDSENSVRPWQFTFDSRVIFPETATRKKETRPSVVKRPLSKRSQSCQNVIKYCQKFTKAFKNHRKTTIFRLKKLSVLPIQNKVTFLLLWGRIYSFCRSWLLCNK